jgi:hypothetical protein
MDTGTGIEIYISVTFPLDGTLPIADYGAVQSENGSRNQRYRLIDYTQALNTPIHDFL